MSIYRREFKFEGSNTIYFMRRKVIGYKLNIYEMGAVVGKRPIGYRKVKEPAYTYKRWYGKSKRLLLKYVKERYMRSKEPVYRE